MSRHLATLLLVALLAGRALAAPAAAPSTPPVGAPSAQRAGAPTSAATALPPGVHVSRPSPPARAESSYGSGTGENQPRNRPPVKVSEERVGALSWMVLLMLAIPLTLVGWLVVSFLRSVGLARAAEAEREAAARRPKP